MNHSEDQPPRDALSGLLPPQLAERMLAGRHALEGERKLVTVLFADVVGSTAMAAGLDPEDVVDILNGLFERWVAAVHRYEGTVDKFLGDGMLALFGAPLAHEDDPRRAVLAALEIRDATHGFRDELVGVDLDVRVGLNTGTVVVGTVGADARMEYTAIGDAVNVAQRVEANARPGSVYISDATRRLVEPYFDLRAAGTFELKGKAEPAALHEVVTTTDVVSAVRGLPGRTTPLVGRNAEYERLARLLEDDEGRSMVALSGDPGVGKTRLVDELRHDHPHLTWIAGNAVAFASTTPFGVLRQMAGQLGVELPIDGSDKAQVDRVGAAFRQAVLAARPAVVFVDDLQWADEASLEAIANVVGAGDSGVGFVATMRPEGTPRAQALGAEVLEVGPLSSDASTHLVSHLLAGQPPTGLDGLIIERSDGNPFFTEELLRTLIEEGSLSQRAGLWHIDVTRVELPPTIQGLVAARLDRLPEATKRAVQAAAILGMTFDPDILTELLGAPADLSAAIEAGFLIATLEGPAFKHGITREVAYGSVLRKTRRTWHLRAAEAMERRHGDARPAEIGMHFDEGNEPERAVPYLIAGAHRAASASSNEAALALAVRATDLSNDADDVLELWELRAAVLGVMGRHDEEWEAVSNMDAIASTREGRLRTLISGARCRLSSKYTEALPLIEEARHIADELDDSPRLADVLLLEARLQRRQYAPERAVPLLEHALDLYRASGDRAAVATTLGELTELVPYGDPRAPGINRAATDAAREARNPRLIAESLIRQAWNANESADLITATEHLDQAVAVADEIGAAGVMLRARRARAYVHMKRDDWPAWDADQDAALELAERTGDFHGWLVTAMSRVEGWESRHRFAELHAWLVETLPTVERWGQVHLEHYVHYALGYRSLRWLGAFDDALHHLRQAVGISEHGLDWIPPEVMYRNGLAAVLVDQGYPAEARTFLDDAFEIAHRHEITEGIVAYLNITAVRLALSEGAVAAASAPLERLRSYLSTPDEGVQHATDYLEAEVALADGRAEDAFTFATAAWEAEPLTESDRWFSQLHVLDLLVRAAEAAERPADDLRASGHARASRFLEELPDRFQATAGQLPHVRRLLG